MAMMGTLANPLQQQPQQQMQPQTGVTQQQPGQTGMTSAAPGSNTNWLANSLRANFAPQQAAPIRPPAGNVALGAPPVAPRPVAPVVAAPVAPRPVAPLPYNRPVAAPPVAVNAPTYARGLGANGQALAKPIAPLAKPTSDPAYMKKYAEVQRAREMTPAKPVGTSRVNTNLPKTSTGKATTTKPATPKKTTTTTKKTTTPAKKPETEAERKKREDEAAKVKPAEKKAAGKQALKETAAKLFSTKQNIGKSGYGLTGHMLNSRSPSGRASGGMVFAKGGAIPDPDDDPYYDPNPRLRGGAKEYNTKSGQRMRTAGQSDRAVEYQVGGPRQRDDRNKFPPRPPAPDGYTRPKHKADPKASPKKGPAAKWEEPAPDEQPNLTVMGDVGGGYGPPNEGRDAAYDHEQLKKNPKVYMPDEPAASRPHQLTPSSSSPVISVPGQENYDALGDPIAYERGGLVQNRRAEEAGMARDPFRKRSGDPWAGLRTKSSKKMRKRPDSVQREARKGPNKKRQFADTPGEAPRPTPADRPQASVPTPTPRPSTTPRQPAGTPLITITRGSGPAKSGNIPGSGFREAENKSMSDLRRDKLRIENEIESTRRQPDQPRSRTPTRRSIDDWHPGDARDSEFAGQQTSRKRTAQGNEYAGRETSPPPPKKGFIQRLSEALDIKQTAGDPASDLFRFKRRR